MYQHGTKSGRISSAAPNMAKAVDQGQVRWQALSDEEVRRRPADPVDMDQIPAHVQRLNRQDKLYNPLARDWWLSLSVAGERLRISATDTLRVWYSGLYDAGITFGSDLGLDLSPHLRVRYLLLPHWTAEQGQHVVEAVNGLERLRGEQVDLGRAGLTAKWDDLWKCFLDTVDPLNSPVSGGCNKEGAWSVLQGMAAAWQKQMNDLNGRFVVRSWARRMIGPQVWWVEMLVDDRLARSPVSFVRQLDVRMLRD